MKELISALMFAITPAYAAPEAAQWGADTDSRYELWDFISGAGLSSEEKWPGLGNEERAATLKKAEETCKAAENSVKAALKGTDASAILATPRKAVKDYGLCLPDSAADAEAAAERLNTLARMEASARAGKLSEADIAWLQANGIRMETEEGKTAALKAKEGARKSGENLAKVSKKQADVSGLSKKGASGLSAMYDKSQAAGAEDSSSPAVGIGKGHARIKPDGPRGSTALSVGHEVPPAPNGAATKYAPVKRDFKSPFPEEDIKALDKAVQAKKEERLKSNYTLGSLGNIRQMVKLAPATIDRGDGPGSGCRDWGEAVAKAINTDPALKNKYEAGVICGAKVPYLSQHCVTVFHRKGADINDPKTDVWYYDAWRKKTESGPIDQQLCRFPVPLEQDFNEGPLGQKTTSKHHISYYDVNKAGPESTTRKVSSAQTNVLFKRGCFD